MTPAAFIKAIGGPDRKPLYIVTGGEPSAVARCLEAALAAVDSGFRDFNYQVLDLGTGEAGRLISEASTGAFFAPPRVVVAKNPAFEGEDWNALADYLENPSENTIILVLDKIDARLKFFKKARTADLEVDCQPPKGAGLVRWLAGEFQNRGVTAGSEVCALIIERAGDDLNTLLGEAEKLSLYLGEGGKLTTELARRLVSLAPGANIFELGEALGRHDVKTGLAVLLDLLATDHHLPVLAMMVRHFRLIFQIKTRQAVLGVKRLGREEAAAMGLHPFVLEKTQGQAAAWPWRDVREALTILEEAHRALVTTSAPPQIIMENLALNLGRLGSSGN